MYVYYNSACHVYLDDYSLGGNEPATLVVSSARINNFRHFRVDIEPGSEFSLSTVVAAM